MKRLDLSKGDRRLIAGLNRNREGIPLRAAKRVKRLVKAIGIPLDSNTRVGKID